MADINRYRVTWTGMPGGPGVSTFYGAASEDMTPAINNFFSAVLNLIPQDVTIQVLGSGDTIDSATGVLSGTWSSTQPGSMHSNEGGAYGAPSGASVQWQTASVVGGHRLRGRTFLVPLLGVQFEANGSLSAPTISTIGIAANALWSANLMYVWHRPSPATPAWTDVRGRLHAAKPATVGAIGQVTAARVMDVVAVLRSRRD